MNEVNRYHLAETIRIASLFVIFVCTLILSAYGAHILVEAVKLLNLPWYFVVGAIVAICVAAFWAADFIFPINKKPANGADDAAQ